MQQQAKLQARMQRNCGRAEARGNGVRHVSKWTARRQRGSTASQLPQLAVSNRWSATGWRRRQLLSAPADHESACGSVIQLPPVRRLHGSTCNESDMVGLACLDMSQSAGGRLQPLPPPAACIPNESRGSSHLGMRRLSVLVVPVPHARAALLLVPLDC